MMLQMRLTFAMGAARENSEDVEKTERLEKTLAGLESRWDSAGWSET